VESLGNTDLIGCCCASTSPVLDGYTDISDRTFQAVIIPLPP